MYSKSSISTNIDDPINNCLYGLYFFVFFPINIFLYLSIKYVLLVSISIIIIVFFINLT